MNNINGRYRMKVGLAVLISLIAGLLQFSCLPRIDNQDANTLTPVPSSVGDGGLLSNKPCGPPCFFGITPGVTTKEEAINILQSYDLYQDCKEYDNLTHGGSRGITCPTVVMVLGKDNGLVSKIGFIPAILITVKEVMAKYGDPTVISVGPVSPTDKQFVTGMTLFYNNIKVSLGLASQKSSKFVLMPDTLITGITYESEFRLDRIYIQEWKGYGVYEQWSP